MVTALLGEDPGARIEEDLTRLKEALGRAHEDRDGLQDESADALGYPPRHEQALNRPGFPEVRILRG